MKGAPRLAVALTATLALCLTSTMAWGNAGGIAGYTGKPNATSAQGQSCNQCHGGGTAPQVRLDGPASLNAGQSAEYTLVVTTGDRASAGVAASTGVTLTAGTGLRASFDELVHDTARAGTTTFRFSVRAPSAGTTLRLWAVGLASNGSGTGGDRAAHVMREVTIAAGATGGAGATPDAGGGGATGDAGAPGAGATGGDDAGSATGSSTGGGGDGDDEVDEPAAAADDDGEVSGDGYVSPRARRGEGVATQPTCAASPSARSDGLIELALAAMAIGLVGARRRRVGVRAGAAALATCAGALVLGCAAESEPSSSLPRTERADDEQAELDPADGRDDTAASCFAACANVRFSCAAGKSASVADLQPDAEGCSGTLTPGDGSSSTGGVALKLDCGARKVCLGDAAGGEATACVSATFSAISFGFTPSSSGAAQVCTRS